LIKCDTQEPEEQP